MSAEPNGTTPGAGHRSSFFRQSGWLMIANIMGGVLMYAVHLLNQKLGAGEYGSFGFFLAIIIVLPTFPVQMILAQQTARSLASGKTAELSGVIRMMWLLTTAAWLIGTAVVLAFQKAILHRWNLSDSVGLWVTIPVVLLSLWLPLFWGVLQGRQNFLWLGWSMMTNGIGRLSVAALAVVALHAGAAGMMAGVLLGIVFALIIGAWHTRDLWLTAPQPFDRGAVLKQIVPLLFAFFGFQLLFTADTLLVKAYFDKSQVDYYVGAGTLARALTWLVLPLAAVMFPRVVQSAARLEKTNLMNLVLLGTAALSILGAAALSLLSPLIVRFLYAQPYWTQIPRILPWYAFAMVPLAVANVLLNNLLAKPDSKWGLAVSVLAVGLGYVVALTQFHADPIMVLLVMGVCNLVFLAVCAFFTWAPKRTASNPSPAAS
jgi:O-antigen/teichoic acid export membrane protein